MDRRGNPRLIQFDSHASLQTITLTLPVTEIIEPSPLACFVSTEFGKD